MTGWGNWGNASVVAGQASSGGYALSVGTAAGGAGQDVAGIVPGTVYRLVAQAKVSDPSETVFVGVNLLNAAGDTVRQMALPVTSTSYTTATFEVTAPSDAVKAVVYVWKNAGSGHAYVDDFVFGAAAESPPSSDNLVANGGFESGMTGWGNWGNASVISGQGSSGGYALSVGTAAGGAGQDVQGIVPGTVYRLVAQAKVSDPSETVFVGVNLLNQAGAAVAQMALPVTGTSYTTVTFDITAPSDAVKAVVYVWKNAGSGLAYVDDFVFGPASASAPPAPAPAWANLVVNGGFENGLANWINWGNTSNVSAAAAAAGSSAAQIGTEAGGFGQTVGGIVAWTSYTLTAHVKLSIPTDLGYLGLKFTDDAGNVLAQNSVTFSWNGFYAPVQVNLTAPAAATKALVYAWKDGGSGFAYVDEVVLAQAPAAASGSADLVSPTAGGALQVAQLANGGHVVVWTASSPANPNDVVYAQLFDASGQKQGGPITVFAAPDGSASGSGFSSSGVAALPDGSFLVSGNNSPVFTRGWSRLLVQKVSATGQLLASGGVSDPSVNGGLANRLLFDPDMNTLGFTGGPFFVNPDGSYVLLVTKTVGPPGQAPSTSALLVNVDSGGNVVAASADLVGRDYAFVPTVVRLAGGNFMLAGTSSNFPSATASIKIVTNTGQEIGRQTLEFVRGTPAIAPLADGTGLVAWYTIQPQPGFHRAERIDAGGNVVGNASAPGAFGRVTGLARGGYVVTWIRGTQLLGQYFTTSGQVAGGVFVVADNVDPSTGTSYAISPTPDGFRVVYNAFSGPQIFEVRTSAPALN